jgi:hypothetical protein
LALADMALRGQPPEQMPTDPNQPPPDPLADANDQSQDQSQNQEHHEDSQHQGDPDPNADRTQHHGADQSAEESADHQPGSQQQEAVEEKAEDAAQHQAAAEADEAQNAQQQAGNNAQAAQEAANALARASQEMDKSLPDNETSDHEEMAEAHSGPHNAHSGRDLNSSEGSRNGDNAFKPVPAVVAAMGINSRDWAKLPPLMQQDLVNAAQQNSLPAYRESIKNYFERIARLKDTEGQPQPANN